MQQTRKDNQKKILRNLLSTSSNETKETTEEKKQNNMLVGKQKEYVIKSFSLRKDLFKKLKKKAYEEDKTMTIIVEELLEDISSK